MRGRALQGSARAQTEFLKIYSAAMASKKAYTEEYLEAAARYKFVWEERFREAEKLGQPVPNVLPHPEDVIVHPNGDIQIVGPMNYGQANAVKGLLEHRDDLIEFIGVAKERLKSEPNNKILQGTLGLFRRRLKMVQKAIPPRLRRSDSLRSDSYSE